jgi:hypothetical protein
MAQEQSLEQHLDHGPKPPELREIVLPPTLKEVSKAIEQAAKDKTQQQLARRAAEILASLVESWRKRRDELRQQSNLPQATLVELKEWANAGSTIEQNPQLMATMVECYEPLQVSPNHVQGPFRRHEKPFVAVNLMPGINERVTLGYSTDLRKFIERIAENLGTLNKLGIKYLEQLAEPGEDIMEEAAYFLPTKFPGVYLNASLASLLPTRQHQPEFPPNYWISVDLAAMDKILEEKE